ncbi:hypothetical protein [Helicobacter ailurogastricus]|uniref:Uncharacterized protein n=1 Tax=Helicobacter ailurogastricus TaxID=1578720 RepID=A0A0K2X5V6_9HELI|nr:hypothetical protein [Helicobacter ailurogastricus]CRF40804.1 hypothetical protein HAL011_05690 [Helicobacter ailurogastricus]CRF42720.1 hypothetical protein HAL013_09200 [Helicobacter ailurogastricus]CRF44915.1 hypothetical protein HAL09_15360 [Helicobacter ailurogastricus]
MPLTFGREGIFGREYQAFYKKKTRERAKIYRDIRDAYGLEIPEWAIMHHAKKAAKAEAEKHFQVFTDIFAKPENLFKFLAGLFEAIFSIVAGVLVSVFTVGIGTPLGATIATMGVAGGVATIAGTMTGILLEEDVKNNFTFYAGSVAGLQSARALLQEAGNLKSTTRLLIYAPYDIFPEGKIYKAENPGTLGYKAGQQAPNCMKGINGTYQEHGLAQIITTTQHKVGPGNAYYDNLKNPFPDAKFQQNEEYVKTALENKIKERMKAIEEGFGKLSAERFGHYDRKSMVHILNTNLKKMVHTRIDGYNSWRFLKKMEFYHYGHRLPFFDPMKKPPLVDVPLHEDGPKGYLQVKGGHYEDKFFKFDDTLIIGADGQLKDIKREEHKWKGYNEASAMHDKLLGFKDKREAYIQYWNLKKGKNVILWRTPRKTPPRMPARAQHFKAIQDNTDAQNKLSDETFERLRVAYSQWALDYWNSFDLHFLDATDAPKPYAFAKERAKEAGIDFKDVFFHTNAEDLSQEEQDKQDMFNSLGVAMEWMVEKEYRKMDAQGD